MKIGRLSTVIWFCISVLLGSGQTTAGAGDDYAGLIGAVGAPEGSPVVRMLRIDSSGVYENLIVDGEWGDFDLVRIRADRVVLRNCTVRNGLRDAVEVYGRDVRIENCKIHHVLKGTFEDQQDAHGITGRPLNLTIRKDGARAQEHKVQGKGLHAGRYRVRDASEGLRRSPYPRGHQLRVRALDFA